MRAISISGFWGLNLFPCQLHASWVTIAPPCHRFEVSCCSRYYRTQFCHVHWIFETCASTRDFSFPGRQGSGLKAQTRMIEQMRFCFSDYWQCALNCQGSRLICSSHTEDPQIYFGSCSRSFVSALLQPAWTNHCQALALEAATIHQHCPRWTHWISRDLSLHLLYWDMLDCFFSLSSGAFYLEVKHF